MTASPSCKGRWTCSFSNSPAWIMPWQGVARLIQRQSEEALSVDHGSLYLALQRIEDKKWISAKWGVSENNRKARFYSLT